MKKKKNTETEGFNEILFYTTPNGKVKVEIYLHNETICLAQQKSAELFGVQRPAGAILKKYLTGQNRPAKTVVMK